MLNLNASGPINANRAQTRLGQTRWSKRTHTHTHSHTHTHTRIGTALHHEAATTRMHEVPFNGKRFLYTQNVLINIFRVHEVGAELACRHLYISTQPNTTQRNPTQHNTTQHPTPNTQHPTHNTQHTTPNTQHTIHNTQYIQINWNMNIKSKI